MGKGNGKNNEHKHNGHKNHHAEAADATPEKMKNKEYVAELEKLEAELVAMQEWVKSSGAKICIVFEGRDTAGKGGTIKAITGRVSPRVFASSRSRHRP